MRCATIGCTGAPVATLVWSDDAPELICGECAESYARRPYVMARAEIRPGVSA